MTPVDETTSGRDDALRQLAESKRASRSADRLIADARATLDSVRWVHEDNHFTDKFRQIIKGAV